MKKQQNASNLLKKGILCKNVTMKNFKCIFVKEKQQNASNFLKKGLFLNIDASISCKLTFYSVYF